MKGYSSNPELYIENERGIPIKKPECGEHVLIQGALKPTAAPFPK